MAKKKAVRKSAKKAVIRGGSKKKRNPQDVTLRNVRTTRADVADLARAVKGVVVRLADIERRLTLIERDDVPRLGPSAREGAESSAFMPAPEFGQ